MSKLLMDQLRPVFNAVAGTDFGAGTNKQIRYSITDYKTLLSRYIDEYLQTGPWPGPFNLEWTLSYNGGSSSNSTTGPGIVGPAGSFNFTATAAVEQATTETEWPNCPFVDGVSDPREDASVTFQGSGSMSMVFNLRTPAIEESGWDTAVAVWLPFNFTASASFSEAYICTPSGSNGNNAGSLTTNFLGIDDAAGLLFPGYDNRIALGDGSTFAYFSASGNLQITDLKTNEF